MSHGEEDGVLFCSDGQEIKVQQVIERFEGITGIPKARIFLSIQLSFIHKWYFRRFVGMMVYGTII